MSINEIEILLTELDDTILKNMHESDINSSSEIMNNKIISIEKKILEFKDEDINQAFIAHIARLKEQLVEFNDNNKHLPIDKFAAKNRDFKILISNNQWKKEDKSQWLTFLINNKTVD